MGPFNRTQKANVKVIHSISITVYHKTAALMIDRQADRREPGLRVNNVNVFKKGQ
jgi:hypothetical protein